MDPHATATEIIKLKAEFGFFHWHLEFPEVFRVPDEVDPMGPRYWLVRRFQLPPWQPAVGQSRLRGQEELHDPGVPSAGVQARGTIGQLAVADLGSYLEVNVVGTWLACRTAAAPMRAAGYGRILTLASCGRSRYSALPRIL